MKLTIINTNNKIKLAKILRQEFTNLTLNETMNALSNLPYSFEELGSCVAKELKQKLEEFAMVELQEDPTDLFGTYNTNINPPKEYTEALNWYNELPEINKSYVDVMIEWRNRPAVC